MCANEDITRLLQAFAENGDSSEDLVNAVYAELHRLAKSQFAKQNSGQTLQATALVNEAYARLFSGQPSAWKNRRHFFAVAAKVMRQVMVDQARRKHAQKRGGADSPKRLEDYEIAAPEKSERVLQVHDALDRLAETDPEAAELVKLRFFVRLTIAEAAEVMGVSVRTANRTWDYARSWLRVEIEE